MTEDSLRQSIREAKEHLAQLKQQLRECRSKTRPRAEVGQLWRNLESGDIYKIVEINGGEWDDTVFYMPVGKISFAPCSRSRHVFEKRFVHVEPQQERPS